MFNYTMKSMDTAACQCCTKTLEPGDVVRIDSTEFASEIYCSKDCEKAAHSKAKQS